MHRTGGSTARPGPSHVGCNSHNTYSASTPVCYLPYWHAHCAQLPRLSVCRVPTGRPASQPASQRRRRRVRVRVRRCGPPCPIDAHSAIVSILKPPSLRAGRMRAGVRACLLASFLFRRRAAGELPTHQLARRSCMRAHTEQLCRRICRHLLRMMYIITCVRIVYTCLTHCHLLTNLGAYICTCLELTYLRLCLPEHLPSLHIYS